MHTTIIRCAGCMTTALIHNSDFSGVVKITDNYEGEPQEWLMPGGIVQAIREHAIDEVLGWLQEFPVCDVEVG